uniref:DUF4780 domain-containing protein n=1 Tax=Macrostomum lignano TaxID=282301 RepID=A0A1I8FKW4_9PLAT
RSCSLQTVRPSSCFGVRRLQHGRNVQNVLTGCPPARRSAAAGGAVTDVANADLQAHRIAASRHACQLQFCLSSLPSLAEACEFNDSPNLSSACSAAESSLAKPTKAARELVLLTGLRRVWSPESAQCLAQSDCRSGGREEASSTISSSTKHLVRQHLNPPVMEEDIREVCRHLGGAVLLSAAADSSNPVCASSLIAASDFSDLPTAAWLIESSGNRQQTRVAL